MVVQNYFVKNNKINIKSTLIAQIVSNTTSLLIILLGMFYLDPSKYVEIQLTLAYLVFCGFMHFGLIDGIELRIAGDIIKKNSNGSLAILIFTLSSLPGLIYFIIYFKSLNINILIAFLAFPIINVNTLLIVLFRSYGYSWIAAAGLILEKFIVIIYLFITAKYAIHLINYFILFSLFSLIFYLYKLNIVNIKLDFGLDLKITLLDLKRGSILMFSNILYSSNFSSLPAKEKILRSIERQQNIKETLYLFLLQKREEASVAKAITTPSIKVVDYAMTNYVPIAPKRSIIYLVALFIGLIIPFGIVYVIFLMDTKIHSKLDFERLSPNIPVVAEIPFIDEDYRIITKNDRSVLAESFRILRTNINYLTPIKKEGECPVIYTCSSIKGEGKTFVSLNLALTFASMDKKVLLIGADLRNPQLHKYLKINKNRIGLSNYLHDNTTSWIDLINEKIFDNDFFNIIFAGSVPPNPAELLSNGRFEELLNILKKQFDYVIIDTAPTILVTDTLLISQLADVTVYVTRADHTDKKLLTYSKGLKEQGKLVNMSYVINNVGGEKGYGYGYKYSYGYSYGYNYGYGYGYGEDSEEKKPRSKSILRWFKRK